MSSADSSKPADPLFRDALEEGVRLYNSGAFWHAHEAWERIWLPSSGEVRSFLQGLIQLAAVRVHLEKKNLRGATRLLESSSRRLVAFPSPHLSVDWRPALEETAIAVREASPTVPHAFLLMRDDAG